MYLIITIPEPPSPPLYGATPGDLPPTPPPPPPVLAEPSVPSLGPAGPPPPVPPVPVSYTHLRAHET